VSKTSAKSPDTDKPDATKKAAASVSAPAPAAKTTKTAPAKTTAAKAPVAKGEAAQAVTTAAPAPGNRFSDRFSPPKPPARGFPEPMETVKPAVKADPKLVNAWKSKAGRELTEPELMAMPEAEYMNDKQLDFFRARLQALKDDLLSNAGETTEHLREDTSIVPDPADRATIEEEHALELRTRDRERKLLKKISQSLGRIEAGDYGYCDETGEPIGLGRLLARPTATLSLEAQQRRELKQKMFGD
jgi:DnaK suppressor protein